MVHRSDGCGTTFIWTDYLSKVSNDWTDGPGKGTSINWPVGVGGKGNEGVAGLVRQMPGAIGYVELIYALQNHIHFGAVQERLRQLDQGLHRRRHRRGRQLSRMPADYRVSITNAPGANCLPDLELHLSADPGASPATPPSRRSSKTC